MSTQVVSTDTGSSGTVSEVQKPVLAANQKAALKIKAIELKLTGHTYASAEKAQRLKERQEGKVLPRVRPLSKRHCLIVAVVLFVVAVSIVLIFTDQKNLLMLINWPR